jgi:glucose-6-phosphate 1-dehydrogenase
VNHNTAVFDAASLQTCNIPAETYELKPFTMVIFGGAGDLSRRKLMPSIFHLFLDNQLTKGFSILGFDRVDLDDNAYRSMMKEAMSNFSEGSFESGKWEEFSRRVFFLSDTFEKDSTYADLTKRLEEISIRATDGTRNVIFYLAVPPVVTPMIVGKLKRFNLCKGPFSVKIIIEKPFGRDHASAVELNRILTDAFDESQIYRIDHYLAKNPVQNIIFFRFCNTIFEEVWNRHNVDNVQITVAEDIGIEHRGVFYEQAGVVRDIVQNHIMQILGLVAMEAPISFNADYIRDEKLKILRAVRPMDERYVDEFTVMGQYGPGKAGGTDVPGYRQEKNVSPASNTPTFFAGKFYVDNLRWSGVPFYVRTGKRMPKRITEICVQFRQLPLRLFGCTCDYMGPNILLLTIQPDEKISLRFGVKYPYSTNQIYSVNMVFNYNETFKTAFPPAYETLLADCMKGDLTLFVREDSVEEMWRITDQITSRWESSSPVDFPNYAAGTWGPPGADLLLKKEGRSWITV